ncbi:hypothetical protein [Burkholderia aenigmatica]|uniref:SMODS and SLOG-associating 2TM effector domain-containing protein n=1 Tax=Burkholderia aenigmatica TaxID=2015348 RepID=A0A228I1R0_9BURK|nr:hypothetical protein [Burkholderia aenigmatica]OXI36326.1 hypothetical protein CFB84_34835 [Burkholderia aenigmatica]
MEPHSQLNDSHLQQAVSLEGQLREIYARAAYTHMTHEKMTAVRCMEAARCSQDVPTAMHSICIRLRELQARAADVVAFRDQVNV